MKFLWIHKDLMEELKNDPLDHTVLSERSDCIFWGTVEEVKEFEKSEHSKFEDWGMFFSWQNS